MKYLSLYVIENLSHTVKVNLFANVLDAVEHRGTTYSCPLLASKIRTAITIYADSIEITDVIKSTHNVDIDTIEDYCRRELDTIPDKVLVETMFPTYVPSTVEQWYGHSKTLSPCIAWFNNNNDRVMFMRYFLTTHLHTKVPNSGTEPDAPCIDVWY